MASTEKPCDLGERTARFGEDMIPFLKTVPEFEDEAKPLWQEAGQPGLILVRIYRGAGKGGDE